MPTKQMEICCPPGVSAGQMLTVQDPQGGAFEVCVPDGVSEGMAFMVEVTLPDFDQAAFAAEMTDMDERSIKLLTAVMSELNSHEGIDAFVNDFCEQFAEYDPESEQSLEWGSLHKQYAQIVEEVLEAVLAAFGSSAEDVYKILEAYSGTLRGERFLAKFLSLADYHTFCAMMKSWAVLEPLF